MRSSLFIAVLGAAPALGVSDAVFSDIKKYTYFAAASYSENCPTPPSGSSVVKFFNNTLTDTQAYLFKAGNEQVLSFRGSSSPRDLDTDLNFTLTSLDLQGASCADCLVHTGFQGALNSILPDIKAALGSEPLTITGHSLGAALASLAAAALKPAKVFTYGEPRNGDSTFASYIQSIVKPSDYYRVTHFNDGVPQIPPAALGYQHHGTEYWESLENDNTASSTKQQSGSEPQTGVLSTDYGTSAINGAHIQYTNEIVAAMLFNPGCGFVNP